MGVKDGVRADTLVIPFELNVGPNAAAAVPKMSRMRRAGVLFSDGAARPAEADVQGGTASHAMWDGVHRVIER